ncbi:MAG: hybrid sensor histidine kinase/response regulator [Candidatus Rokuibacteriota bacterium]
MLNTSGTWTLRAHLIALVIAAILPISVFAAAAVVFQWHQQRDESTASLGETVDATLLAVEGELESAVTILEAMAASRPLTSGNVREFYAEAGAMLPTHRGWRTIILIAPAGDQIFNLRAPIGTTLPRADLSRGYLRTAARDRRAGISDLFVGRVSGTPTLHVAVPVERDGALKYVLVAGIAPEVFGRSLQGEHVRDVAGVFDREYRFIARSREPEKYLGQRPVAALLEAMGQRPEGGVGRFESYDEQAVYTTWRRSGIGWTVAVAVPAASVEAPLRRSLLLLGGSVVVLLVGGSMVAGLLARRLSRAIDVASAAARRMTKGDAVEASPTSVAEIRALIDTMRDGSELLRRAERERAVLLTQEQEARERAETANRAKDEFLAMFGHELRNPLNVIRTGLEVLERTGARDEGAARTRQLMARQLRHLTELVDDLLDVARVTSGKIVLTRRALDLGALVTRAVAALADAGRTSRHAVRQDVETVWVEGDETRLEQIVTNLVGNALKFTPPGGAITVTVRAEDRDAVLRVEDTGLGIAPDVLSRIFGLFVQADRSLERTQGGLGLGLALVRRLTEMHGGTAEATSDGVGRGAVFTVRLPRIDAPVATSGERRKSAGARPRRQRVLIVEDNTDGREMVRTMLELQGHEVYEASDGRAGIERALALDPDIMIVDIGLPGVDGYEVARTIRAKLDGRGIRLIALTGYGREEDRLRAAAAGFNAHLVKPVDPERLEEVLADPSRRFEPAPQPGDGER